MIKKAQKGSITVFLSLLMMLLISVVTVSLESAHQTAVRSQISVGSSASMDMLFSHYNNDLFDQYKLLFMEDQLDLETILREGMAVYESPGKGLLRGVHHLGFETESVTISKKTYLLDNKGEAFQKEVNEIVTADIVNLIKNKLIKNIGRLRQSETISNYMREIGDKSSDLSEMAEQVGDAGKKADGVNKSMTDITTGLGNCVKDIEQYKKNLNPDAEEKPDHSEQVKKVQKELGALSESKIQAERNLREIITKLAVYEDDAKEITENMESVKAKLEKEDLDEEFRAPLNEELNAVLSQTSESGEEYQNFVQARKQAEDNLKRLQLIDIPVASETSMMDGSLSTNMQNVAKEISACGNINLPVPNPEKDGGLGALAKKLISTAKKIKNEGVLAVMVGDTSKLSKRELDTSAFPSKIEGIMEGAAEEDRSMFLQIVDSAVNTMAMNLYLYHYLDNYMDEGNYDLEYVLAGKSSDKENLTAVIGQLLMLRTVLNEAYLLMDTTKRAQAKTAATALLAACPYPAFILALQFVLMTAWAFAEAVVDVRGLLAGKEVPIMKNEQSWNLSLQGAADISKEAEAIPDKKNLSGTKKGSSLLTKVGETELSEKDKAGSTPEGNGKKNPSKETGDLEEPDDPFSFGYKEYLLILMFFHSHDSNMFRGLDMIQWNVAEKEADFRISQCIYGLEADFSLQSKPVFLVFNFPGLGKIERYRYGHKEKMDYS